MFIDCTGPGFNLVVAETILIAIILPLVNFFLIASLIFDG